MEIIPARNIISSLVVVAKVIQTILLVLLTYFALTTIFSFFGFTKTWSAALLDYLARPVTSLVSAVLDYLPNLFFILVIGVVTNYVLRFIKLIFQGLGSNTIRFPGFYPEWAIPTYKIVRFLILAFVAVIIFPYLPGSNSPAFQGVSIFLGILFSLGSSSAIANVVAGVVLTYMRPFRPGDRVKIADAMGDVIEKTLLVTRIRTIKNLDISIPNAMVLGSHIINYNSSSREKGLILHTSVTIGYDVPWRRVQELLLSAARGTPSILPDPSPFVLQTALDDFYVKYEVNAYTDRPNEMAQTYSALHQSIQDKFFEAGVEICSPHFTAVRDGNAASIPEDHLPAGYKAPAFRIHLPGFPGGKEQRNTSTPPEDAGGQKTSL
jgi:small-conductance mechanosensitive channel